MFLIKNRMNHESLWVSLCVLSSWLPCDDVDGSFCYFLHHGSACVGNVSKLRRTKFQRSWLTIPSMAYQILESISIDRNSFYSSCPSPNAESNREGAWLPLIRSKRYSTKLSIRHKLNFTDHCYFNLPVTSEPDIRAS